MEKHKLDILFSKNKRAQFFTHNDLDGVVSNLQALKFYSGLGYYVSTEITGYNDIDNKILNYVNSRDYSTETLIFITDISCSPEVAEFLDKLPNPKTLIDHHSTNVFLNKYSWADVREGDSASLMVYRHLKDNTNNAEFLKVIDKYFDLIKITDLWDSKPRDSAEYIKNKETIDKINMLFSGIGLSNFRLRFMANPSIEFTESEYSVIDCFTRLMNSYCRFTKIYKLKHHCGGDASRNVYYGFGFSEKYISQVSSYALDNDHDLAFVILINMNGLSLSFRRNTNNKYGEVIDLSKIASQFGGGGHPYASGANFNFENYYEIITRIQNGDFDV